MSLTLVILAAGASTRYGSAKQLAAVGPGGEAIIDFVMYDALRAGFEQVVLVVRPETEPAFRAHLEPPTRRHVAVRYVHQRLADLPVGFAAPAGRTRPWGTGHAVLAAAAATDGPFAVANADDLCGRGSYALLVEFLKQHDPGDAPTYALVGFRLADTLADSGPVSRGVCRRTPDGWLDGIQEITHIERDSGGGRYVSGNGTTRALPGDTLVSMNLWGFRPPLLEQLRRRFADFLHAHGQSAEREFYLPAAIDHLIRTREARVRVLPTNEHWCGLTHSSDTHTVRARIRTLIDAGTYPTPLWG